MRADLSAYPKTLLSDRRAKQMNTANTSNALTVEAFIYTEKKQDRQLLTSAAKIFIAAVGSLGTAFSFLSCVDTGVSFVLTAAVISAAVLVFGIVFSLSKKYFIPAFSVLFTAYASALFILRNKFCNGLANVMNIYLAMAKKEYREKLFIEIADPSATAYDTAVFVLLTVIFISMVYCYGIVGETNLPAVLAVSVPPVELCLYYGFAPSYFAFFAVLASWFAVFAFDLSMPEENKAYKKASAQCGFTAAAFAFLCALAVLSVIRLCGYTRPQAVNDLNDTINGYIHGQSLDDVIGEIKLPEIKKATGAVNHGKLGENGNITFNNKTVLQVTIPRSSETIYLRGFVGSVYTGNSWEELPKGALSQLQDINSSFETEGLNSLLLSSYNLKMSGSEMPEYSFSVTNINAGNEYLYMPYNLVPESVSRYQISNDAFISDGAEKWFGKIYYPNSVYGYKMILSRAWTVPSAALANDQSGYRNFVNANYLDVPDTFHGADTVFTDRYYEFITQENQTEGKSTLTDATVFGRKLYYIKTWLRDNCEYNLNAGKLPAGKDFADYFINETHKGSCSHFASAAVLLCRYAGIPARYVEGYVIKPGDFSESLSFSSSETIDVTDARAHAWAEVYINGFGWYPLEFTSGYGNVQTAVTTVPVTEEITESEPEQTAQTEVSQQPANEQADGTAATQAPSDNTQQDPQTSVAVSETTAPAAEQTDAVSEGSAAGKQSIGFSIFGSGNGERRDVVYDLTLLVLAVCIISTAVAVIGIRRIIIVKNSRNALRGDKKAAVKKIYRRFGRLIKTLKLSEQGNMTCKDYADKLSAECRYLSDGTAALVINTALKSEFGGEMLTADDVKEMDLAVSSAVKQYINSLNRAKKFYVQFMIGLI